MKRIPSGRKPALTEDKAETADVSVAHGGLRLNLDTATLTVMEVSLLKGLACAGGRLVVVTAHGFRPLKALELQQRLIDLSLKRQAERVDEQRPAPLSRRELLRKYPLWACEEALKEGEWPRIPIISEQDDQAEKTAQGLALLRDAIAGAPDDAVTTNWLLANEGPLVKRAMKLIGRQVTARHIGHVLRDLGPAVGIWSADRRGYGVRWAVGIKPGQAKADEEKNKSQGAAAKPRVK